MTITDPIPAEAVKAVEAVLTDAGVDLYDNVRDLARLILTAAAPLIAAQATADLCAELTDLRASRDEWASRMMEFAEAQQALTDLRAGIEALHRPVHVVGSWNGELRMDPICETCHGKAGVHECGCWADEDLVPECAECTGKTGKRQAVAWPCPTIRALDALLREGE